MLETIEAEFGCIKTEIGWLWKVLVYTNQNQFMESEPEIRFFVLFPPISIWVWVNDFSQNLSSLIFKFQDYGSRTSRLCIFWKVNFPAIPILTAIPCKFLIIFVVMNAIYCKRMLGQENAGYIKYTSWQSDTRMIYCTRN